MKEGADVKRPYRAKARAAAAQATRVAIIEAATDLFVERGFGPVSIDDIAAAAGVARATVFTAVGGKAAVLRAVYDVAVVGDDEPVPLPDRPWARPVREAPDGPTMLDRYARMVTTVDRRVAGVWEVLRRAAGAHDDVRAHWDEIRAERRAGAANVVTMLRRHGPLRPGLRPSAAADLVEVLIDPGLYFLLVDERGWSERAFERWLAETLRAQLLSV